MKSFVVKHQITQVTQLPAAQIWHPVTSGFPKIKITVEREGFSDHQWDSGKYNRATDGDWEKCVRSQSAYFEGDWSIIVLCTMFPISCIFFNNVSIFHIAWLDTFWSDLILMALADVAPLVRTSSHNRKVVGLIPTQGTYLGCWFDPKSRHIWSPVQVQIGGNWFDACLSNMSVCLSLSLSLSISLFLCLFLCLSLPPLHPTFLSKSNFKMLSSEDKKRKWYTYGQGAYIRRQFIKGSLNWLVRLLQQELSLSKSST